MVSYLHVFASRTSKSGPQDVCFGNLAQGAVKTDATLQVVSHLRVFALGDECFNWISFLSCHIVQGAAKTDATLRVVSHSRVFALGDVSGVEAPPSNALPITAQVRLRQKHVVCHG